MLSPSSQPLSGLVKQWVGDRLRRGPEALLQAAARRGPEAALRAPAATTRDLPPQVPHGTEEQSNPNASRCAEVPWVCEAVLPHCLPDGTRTEGDYEHW